jgi:hypothetical protein
MEHDMPPNYISMGKVLGRATLVLLSAGQLISCFAHVETISSRSPATFEKVESSPFSSRVPEDPVGPELWVRSKDVVVEPRRNVDDSGSLFDVEDERNHLFQSKVPTVGSWLHIGVASNRVGEKPADGEVKDAVPGDELLKALPTLEPADKDPAPIKNFKVRIIHIQKNGDAIVQHQRRSTRDEDAVSVTVTGRIPWSRLTADAPLTTDDIADIKWQESKGGEFTERRSVNWEDEYTIRMSGFDEAKSKEAKELEEKRKQLLGVREKLDTRIRTLADERATMTKQRDEFVAKQKADAEKLAELQKTVDEQTREIQRFNEEKTKQEEEAKKAEETSDAPAS